MKDAYVYYRVAPDSCDAAASHVDTLLTALSVWCDHPPRRRVRCSDALTWMEIYEGIADWRGFTYAMQHALASSPLASFIDGERHLECFAAPSPMALGSLSK